MEDRDYIERKNTPVRQDDSLKRAALELSRSPYDAPEDYKSGALSLQDIIKRAFSRANPAPEMPRHVPSQFSKDQIPKMAQFVLPKRHLCNQQQSWDHHKSSFALHQRSGNMSTSL
jgi:hypothetical protein